MNKREEDFEKSAMDYCEDHSHCIYFEAGAEYGYQYAMQHPQWIPVEERLPEITIDNWRSDDLLFVTDDGVVRYGFYRDGGVWFSSVRGFLPHQVTDWMPLPQPPVKKRGEQ